MKNKKVISKLEYIMLNFKRKQYYSKCDLCDNYFIMEEGGIYEENNNINVCDNCLIDKQLN